MCGFCGYVNKDDEIQNATLIESMNLKLRKRGPNDYNTYIDKKVALGHCRLSIIDIKNGAQPMIKDFNNNEYVIVYNGELYNTKELKDHLISKGYKFKTTCDTEVILNTYIEYGKNCVEYFNGIFAFAIYTKKNCSLFLARDRLGIKPLFYYYGNNTFIFASEIKAILEHPDVPRILDKYGVMELVGLGPAHSPGKTYFKDIFELKAGFYASFENFSLSINKYWDLETKECFDDEKKAISTIHELVTDSTKKQLISDVGICTMLSGGLDSSILTKIANNNVKNLTTFSINYSNNEKDFKANDYQMTKDSDFVKIMCNVLQTNHKEVIVDSTSLFDYLHLSMISRDMPGMADIDSSMYIFCKEIAKDFKVCLSGECSDEIFGGYPWFYKEHLINHDGFPWALSENLRKNILNSDIIDDNELLEYINEARKSTLKHVSFIDGSDDYEKRFKSINYLTVKWFMSTLVERTDRTSMANSLEVRVPFADHRIFEYVYNLPARMKLGINNSNSLVEKYLLRKAFEDELPKEVVYRKKSPFPKTYDPIYLSLVEKRLLDILSNKKLKVHKIINSKFMLELINSHGNSLKENWFGQLMTYPQTLAYIIQISDWLEEYKIEIAI